MVPTSESRTQQSLPTPSGLAPLTRAPAATQEDPCWGKSIISPPYPTPPRMASPLHGTGPVLRLPCRLQCPFSLYLARLVANVYSSKSYLLKHKKNQAHFPELL